MAPDAGLEVDLVAPESARLFVGEDVQLTARIWHGVASVETVWHTSNTRVLTVDGRGRVQARGVGEAVVTVSAGPAVDSLRLEVVELPRLFDPQELAYFAEVAFGTEEGNASAALRRWGHAPRVALRGSPGPQDRSAVERVVADLNALVPSLGMEITDTDPNVELHFAPVHRFASLEPNYVSGNLGFFWVWWNREQEITRARVLIATDHVDQAGREHLIREELTQMLGLMRDSWSYPQSIFYQGWTETAAFADIDRSVIRMLYRPELNVGQSREQALAVLEEARQDPAALRSVVAAAHGRSAGSGGGSGGLAR